MEYIELNGRKPRYQVEGEPLYTINLIYVFWKICTRSIKLRFVVPLRAFHFLHLTRNDCYYCYANRYNLLISLIYIIRTNNVATSNMDRDINIWTRMRGMSCQIANYRTLWQYAPVISCFTGHIHWLYNLIYCRFRSNFTYIVWLTIYKHVRWYYQNNQAASTAYFKLLTDKKYHTFM